MKMTDQEIIIEYLSGKKDIFGEIVNRYIKPIYNFAYRIVGNERIAEDMAQETFLKAWKNIKKYDTEESFKTWIFSIAKNTCVDYLRKRKDIPMSAFDDTDGGNAVEDILETSEPNAIEIFAIGQNKKQVEKAIEKLTIIQKEVITLKYVNGMSLSEVAEVMEIPTDTAKSHHRRALLKLKKLLVK